MAGLGGRLGRHLRRGLHPWCALGLDLAPCLSAPRSPRWAARCRRNHCAAGASFAAFRPQAPAPATVVSRCGGIAAWRSRFAFACPAAGGHVDGFSSCPPEGWMSTSPISEYRCRRISVDPFGLSCHVRWRRHLASQIEMDRRAECHVSFWSFKHRGERPTLRHLDTNRTRSAASAAHANQRTIAWPRRRRAAGDEARSSTRARSSRSRTTSMGRAWRRHRSSCRQKST